METLITILILLNSFNWVVSNDVIKNDISYPENIEACSVMIWSAEYNNFHEVCDKQTTLDYINSTVDHPNY